MPPSLPRRPQRPRLRLVAAAVAAALAGSALWVGLRDAPVAPQVAAPWEFSTDTWDAALGGDQGYTQETYTRLRQQHDGLSAGDAAALVDLAGDVAAADLTGAGRDRWPQYWPPRATTTTQAPRRCTSVDVQAASPAALPLDRSAPGARRAYAKVLVAYTGTCGPDRYTLSGPGVEYVYATRSQDRWTPIRLWDVPALAEHVSAQAQNEPQPWQLKPLGPCGIIDGDRYQARTVVADAFAKMCQDAAADRVTLVLEAGHRTRAEQAALFTQAVKYYGSPETARQWVAYADTTRCESRACAGLSVGVEPDHAALTWLRSTVGCSVNGTVTLLPGGQGGCPAGASIVQRAQRYGFVAPVDRIPGYLEYILPLAEQGSSPADCAPAGVPVPNMVASIFRCRLSQAGVTGAAAEDVVAQALVVSKCSSQWNATAQLFAGRYARAANPADGRVYSETGVFALRRELAQAGWVAGGPAKLVDPVANINAAASLWLATRGWEQFPCAVGTDPQLKVAATLPDYGGPALPGWARQY